MGTNVRADDDESELDPVDTAFQLHGFVSQGALLSSDNNYLAETERGTVEFTEVGLTVWKPLGERLRFGAQLFARDLGPVGNYSAKFDWFHLDYRWRDWLGLRAGRVKVPYGLYNDSSDIDAAQPVVLLPQSIYPATSREILLAQTGLELYGFQPLVEHGGALDYRVFGGTVYLQPPADTPPLAVDRFAIPFLAGARLLWETPVDGLRLGGTWLSAQLELDVTEQTMGIEIHAKQRIDAWIASAEYQTDVWLFAAEYSRWYSRFESDSPAFPPAKTTEERAYGMAAYRWQPWLQTSAYYSLFYPDVANRVGREQRQHDAALCARFDITPHWLVKLEGHLLRGTAALDPALNDNTPTAELTNHWWLLAAKTTAYF